MMTKSYTKSELTCQIRKMGVKPNDLLTVHTALRAVGNIETEGKSGAHILIEALKDAVPQGLLLIPSHTFKNIREEPVFNIRETMHCIGTVPSVAVTLANEAYDRGDKTCIRSFHVSHSVVAFGEKALEYTEGDRKAESAMSDGGSYAKLYEQGGKILLIGIGIECNTFIHRAYEALEPQNIPKPYNITSTDYDRSVVTRVVRNAPGGAKWYKNHLDWLDEHGGLVRGKIGNAPALLCDARLCQQMVLELKEEVRKELALQG